MCMIDDGERCDVWLDSRQRARKPHKCCECQRAIEPGETYLRIFSVYDGLVTVFKLCTHCDAAGGWLVQNCGGYLLPAIGEDLREHAESYRRLDLYRLVAGMRRKWRRRSGALMPVPTVPRPLEPGRDNHAQFPSTH